jgi:predicted nucleic acid-binding protein
LKTIGKHCASWNAPMNEVMIDTCAWIDFLRKKEGVLGDAVVKLIEFDKAVICDVVVAELLQGAKGKN